MNIVDQRCSNHALREAAVQCPSCKRFFCRECVTEDQGRMICVRCVTARVEAQPRARFQARWTVMAAAGVVLAWLLFYYLGLTLSRIPSEFHAEPESLLRSAVSSQTEPRPAGVCMSLRLTDGDEERSWRWDDRSLRSRLGERLISRSAHSEPRPQGAIFTSFSAACLSCSAISTGDFT